jgi:hypothetical protein
MTKFLQALFQTDANFVEHPLIERISYRYITRRNIPTSWEKKELVHKKKLIELGLENSRTYEIERIFTKGTVSQSSNNQDANHMEGSCSRDGGGHQPMTNALG